MLGKHQPLLPLTHLSYGGGGLPAVLEVSTAVNEGFHWSNGYILHANFPDVKFPAADYSAGENCRRGVQGPITTHCNIILRIFVRNSARNSALV